MKITENQRKMIMAMCTAQGIDDETRAELAYQFSTCRTSHISELKSTEAAELISRLKRNQGRTETTMDVWRKRLMAAVGAYLRAFGYSESAAAIKTIACRAAGMPNADCFNQIPLERLRGLYNAFRNAARDRDSVTDVTEELAAAAALAN